MKTCRANSRFSAVAAIACAWTIGVVAFAEVALPEDHFQARRAEFSVRFKDVVSDLQILGVYVLPEEVLRIAVAGHGTDDFRLEAPAGSIAGGSPKGWSWQAPHQAGLYSLSVIGPSGAGGAAADSITLNVFVMVPGERMDGESLRDYKIGFYPDRPPKRLPRCKVPGGFVEVTPENADALISPHFTLGQFVCKQESGYPKYVVLQEKLLVKLERILEKANEEGYRCDTFHVMSGYRTPHYNAALGNAKFSQHLWGGAADVFIDHAPRDGVMDDLNRDGVIDYRDAAVLHRIVDRLSGESSNGVLIGGLAKYRKTSSHGPYVHVDVRGYRARWGI